MWRSRSTLVLIGHLFRDMFASIGTGKTLSMEVKTSTTRSLRELIHSVTREGVQAAILQPPIPEDAARAQIDQLRAPDVEIPNSENLRRRPPTHFRNELNPAVIRSTKKTEHRLGHHAVLVGQIRPDNLNMPGHPFLVAPSRFKDIH